MSSEELVIPILFTQLLKFVSEEAHIFSFSSSKNLEWHLEVLIILKHLLLLGWSELNRLDPGYEPSDFGHVFVVGFTRVVAKHLLHQVIVCKLFIGVIIAFLSLLHFFYDLIWDFLCFQALL